MPLLLLLLLLQRYLFTTSATNSTALKFFELIFLQIYSTLIIIFSYVASLDTHPEP